jgi:hypothetical protein
MLPKRCPNGVYSKDTEERARSPSAPKAKLIFIGLDSLQTAYITIVRHSLIHNSRG